VLHTRSTLLLHTASLASAFGQAHATTTTTCGWNKQQQQQQLGMLAFVISKPVLHTRRVMRVPIRSLATHFGCTAAAAVQAVSISCLLAVLKLC
jgi:hypothetical protein